MNQLESQSTRQTVHQLRCVSGTTEFFICLKITTKYKVTFEQATQQQQAVDMDKMAVRNPIGLLMKAF